MTKFGQNDLYILVAALLSNCAIGAPATTDDSIIVIPFKQTNEKLQRLSSYRINGYDIIRHISSQESANKLLQTLSDLPEWEQLNDAMDDITVGDVYRAMYPNGFLHALNERILLRYGITTESLGKSLVLPEFSLHKIPIIPSTTTSEPKSSNNTETEQFDEHIYDDVNEERTNNLREQPLPDYAYDDQPIASREFVSTSAAREIRHVKGNRPKTVEKLPNERIEMGIYDWIQKFMSR